MPHSSQVILICLPHVLTRAQQVASELEAAARGEQRYRITILSAEEMEPTPPPCRAAIFLIDEEVGNAGKHLWRDLAGRFDEMRVPVLAIVGHTEAGARWCPETALAVGIDAPANQISARLEALLHQQLVIEQLRDDLQLAQRFQGGLRGEISRMHDEMQLAARVQQEILPRTIPSLHGVQFAVLWRPAHYVSGDIYDIARLDEDHVGVFIADVVGHGVPAALLTMVLARALQTKEIRSDGYRIVPPGEALGILNQEMIRIQGDSTRFATAAYAVIDCRARVMKLASAGHPAPFLLRAGEPPIELGGGCGLLGVFDDEAFGENEVELQVGDRLLFYSDGFELAFPEEPSPHGRKMPTRRYMKEFAALADTEGGPQEMIFEMARKVNDHPGSLHQTDDLTMIAAVAGPLVADTRAEEDGAPAEARAAPVSGQMYR